MEALLPGLREALLPLHQSPVDLHGDRLWKRGVAANVEAVLRTTCQIVGIDILPECMTFEEDQIAIRIGDQADTAFLSDVIGEFGPPDIVLDDGGHVMSHVVASFSWLYPRVAPGGIYMVEDLHTAYWPEYGGGLCRAGSFIELCKHLIDELNADWSRGELKPNEFTRTTQSMHFYDSMAVFERGRTLVKCAPMIPPLEAASLEADRGQSPCCPPLDG